ncbi:MAG: hypothetical protein ACTSP4_01615 [Candidatus Hodarchaeales archaeon]
MSTNLSNPFSTGGGGVTFEQLVGASYLATLLTGGIPRGLDQGIVKEVKFQQRWTGFILDDIVITTKVGSTERKLALQVKHDLVFSDAISNKTFERVMKDCWETFTGSSGCNFDPEKDRLGIGIGVYQTKIDKYLQSLLDWARVAKDSSEFLSKVRLPSFSSNEMRDFLKIFNNVLSRVKGSEITDDEFWRLLRCLVVIHFDLEHQGSRDSLYCWNKLLDLLHTGNGEQARLLFDNLISITAEFARSSGVIDLDILKGRIPSEVVFKDYIDFSLDLEYLRNHSNIILESIRDTIGENVHLLRNDLIDLLKDVIKEKEVVVIKGEPMIGKSVLLKLLANRLRSEGEILAFSTDRFFGTSLDVFLHNLNVQSDFLDILSAIRNAPLRCILIDGLEKALYDENRRRILNDLIIAIRTFNKSMIEEGGYREYCWKIVFTCRSLETMNIVPHLETRKNLSNNTLGFFEFTALSEDEIQELISHIPKLRDLFLVEKIKEIVSKPLVLDIMTLSEVILPSDEIPEIYTESLLYTWFWKQIVRLAERRESEKGLPDQREDLALKLAKESIKGDRLVISEENIDANVVNGLISDRFLSKQDSLLSFGQDIYEEWSLTTLLQYNMDDLPKFLTDSRESLLLGKAFRLYVLKLLEVDKAPKAWISFLIELENCEKKHGISPRWYHIVMRSFLVSPLLEDNLPAIKEDLFKNKCVLLKKLLKTLRTACVEPDSSILTILGDLPEEKLEAYIAYTSVPVVNQWIPVINLILENMDKLPDSSLFESSIIFEKWMVKVSESKSHRKDIVKICIDLLKSQFLKRELPMDLQCDLKYKEMEELTKNLIKSVLWGADCSSELVEEFVRQIVLNDHKKEYSHYDFNNIILESGWIPICKYTTNLSVDILEHLLCERLEPDRYGSFHHLTMNLGIRSVIWWNPPTYLKGPFLFLLRINYKEGIRLIHSITNHATKCWKIREELDWKKTPLPQVIKLSNRDIKVWGDELVFQWFRYPSVGPQVVNSALMALEYWMNEQFKEEIDPKVLFDSVLSNTESVAIAGVCVSVALKNPQKCLEAIVPILENPVFWIMDIARSVKDIGAESIIRLFSTSFSFKRDKPDYDTLTELANESHRKLDIRSFVILAIYGPKQIRERIQKRIQSFSDNIPFLYEEEKKDVQLIQERTKTMEIWASQAKQSNYDFLKTDRGIEIQFKLPNELRDEEWEKNVEETNKLRNFLPWAMNFRDKGILNPDFTLETALEYVLELETKDDINYKPKNILGNPEERANSLAAFASSLVIHQWDWVKKKNLASWCKKQLIIAATRPELDYDYVIPENRYPMGYRRSAALGLPSFLLKEPNNKKVRKLIEILALHKNIEIQAYLFTGLGALWTSEQEVVWKCISLVIKAVKTEFLDNKYPHPVRKPKVFFTKLIMKVKIRFTSFFYPFTINTGKLMENDVFFIAKKYVPVLASLQHSDVTKSDHRKLITLLVNLLEFTFQAYILNQEKRRGFNKWTYNDWNQLFFKILAYILLKLPDEVVLSKFGNPVLNNWEKAPAMMEEFLRYLLLTGSRSDLENQFVKLWLKYGERILSSEAFRSISYDSYLDEHQISILGLLIFHDRFSNWKVEEWEPLYKMQEFIDRWCNTVGHNIHCFANLIRFLSTIGFKIVPESGIQWLYNAILRANNIDTLLKKNDNSTELVSLLSRSWFKYREHLLSNQEQFQKFTFLIDKLAEQGDQFAIRLQSKLLDL